MEGAYFWREISSKPLLNKVMVNIAQAKLCVECQTKGTTNAELKVEQSICMKACAEAAVPRKDG